MHDKIIYWDFDGVITNSGNQIIKLGNKDFKTNVPLDSWNEWNFSDCFSNITPEQVMEYFRNPDFFKDLHYIDEDMLSVLKILHKLGFDSRVATIGCEKNIELKKQWIKENLPFFNLKDSHFLIKEDMGKGSVDLKDGIIVDDHIKNLTSSNSWHKICFGKITEYNKTAEDLGFTRTRTSIDLLLHILGLIKEGSIKD